MFNSVKPCSAPSSLIPSSRLLILCAADSLFVHHAGVYAYERVGSAPEPILALSTDFRQLQERLCVLCISMHWYHHHLDKLVANLRLHAQDKGVEVLRESRDKEKANVLQSQSLSQNAIILATQKTMTLIIIMDDKGSFSWEKIWRNFQNPSDLKVTFCL